MVSGSVEFAGRLASVAVADFGGEAGILGGEEIARRSGFLGCLLLLLLLLLLELMLLKRVAVRSLRLLV